MNEHLRAQIQPFCAENAIYGQYSSAATAERTAAHMARIYQRAAAAFEYQPVVNIMRVNKKPRPPQPAPAWLEQLPVSDVPQRAMFLPRRGYEYRKKKGLNDYHSARFYS